MKESTLTTEVEQKHEEWMHMYGDLEDLMGLPEELPDPDLTDIAKTILKKRYLIKNLDGEVVETPKEMFWRVAKFIASAEYRYGANKEDVIDLAVEFYKMMSQGYWLPNSPTLANAGRPGGLGQLSACFVLPVEDAMSNGEDGIYDTLTNMALIHQGGGGTGFSFNRLRPEGSIVKSTTGVASGPVSFMSLYDASTDVVRQGGMRRGANMGILRVDHPDIMEFIDCKQDTSKITNFNVSVAVTDEFMEAVKYDDDYELRWGGEGYGMMSARYVWEKICENAWATGEPGLFFIDEANRHNPVPHLGDYEATNPCAEQCLLPYDVCNLGSLNLGKFVEVDENGYKYLNKQRMEKYIKLSVRFLDNVIDVNDYILPQIEKRAKSIRRIGNGVMGFADMLIKMDVAYGSDQSLKIAESVADFFVRECKRASRGLAEERGVYPEAKGDDKRNCNVTTVAPTGTISMIAGCSGGIEPLYAVVMKRNQAGEEMMDVNPLFAKAISDRGGDPEIVAELVYSADTKVSAVPDDVRELFQTSATVTPENHIRMQAQWQKYICNAISKTINLPREATLEDVQDAYMLAYELDCKGVTVYRDGSRPGQVLSTGKTEDKDDSTGRNGQEAPAGEQSGEPVRHGRGDEFSERPEVLSGTTRKVDSPIGSVYVTLNEDGAGNPYEAIIAIGKAGGTAHSFGEAIGRLISLALRSGVDVENIYKQLRGISSERAVGMGPNKVLSGPDAIALAIGKTVGLENGVEPSSKADDFATCPECNSELYFSEGCATCHNCGYSKCS